MSRPKVVLREVAPGRWEVTEEKTDRRKEWRLEFINTILFFGLGGLILALMFILRELVQ